MNEERARAYGRVVKTLDDMGPSKLLEREQDLIREAADTLLFSADPSDEACRAASRDVELLAQHLVECERWSPEGAEQLVADVSACGLARVAVLAG
jgi:hypothetical protein